MKKSILALCALTLAASLVACGGGTSTYAVGGTVTGLQYGPLVLVTNGMEVSIDAKTDASGNAVATSYIFPKQLEYGEAYDVTLKTSTDASGTLVYQQPPHQVCSPSTVPGTSTRDTAGRLSVINADFVCSLTSHTVGGTITGLAADGLVLNNGSVSTGKIVKDATTGAYPTAFTFPVEVPYGQTYGATVLEQPTGQTCTVRNGAGDMKDDPVTTIEVTCVNNPV